MALAWGRRLATPSTTRPWQTFWAAAPLPVEILVNGKVISTGTAAGGYNIARAQIGQGPTVGEWVSDV